MESLQLLLPDLMTPAAGVLLVAASFFTSAFTAAFGVGGGVAMLALMGWFLPVAVLIPVHGAVQLGSNTGRAWHLRASIGWAIFRPFFIGALFGAVIGGAFVIELPDAPLKVILGIFIILVTFTSVPGFDRLSRGGLLAGGFILSALTMLLGATGPLISAFFSQIFPVDRKALVATHAAAMTVLHLLKIVAFGVLGFAFYDWLPLIAAMIATGYLGTLWGASMLHAVSEKLFRLVFRVLLTILALDLVRRGLVA